MVRLSIRDAAVQEAGCSVQIFQRTLRCGPCFGGRASAVIITLLLRVIANGAAALLLCQKSERRW